MTTPPATCQLVGTPKFTVLSVEAAEVRSNAATATTTNGDESLPTTTAVQLSTNPQAVAYAALSLDPLALRLADAIGAQWAFGPSPRPPTVAHSHHDDNEALIVNATASHPTEATTTDSTNRTLEVPVHTAPKVETLVDTFVPFTKTTTTTEAAVTNAATFAATTTETTTMLVRDTLHGGFLALQQSLAMANHPDAVAHQPAAAVVVTSQFATLPTATSTGANEQIATEQRVLPLFSAQLPSKVSSNKADVWKRDELAVSFRVSVPTLDTTVPALEDHSTTTAETLTRATETALESSPHQDVSPVQPPTRAAVPPMSLVGHVEESVTAAVGMTSQKGESSECASVPEPKSSSNRVVLAERDSETIEPASSELEPIAPDPVEPIGIETVTMDTLVATDAAAAALSESIEPPAVSPLETVELTAELAPIETDVMGLENSSQPMPDVEPSVVNALTAKSNDEAGWENNAVGAIEYPSNEADVENAATQVIESMIANSFQCNEPEVCPCVFCYLHRNVD
jgi:hypothetical protein